MQGKRKLVSRRGFLGHLGHAGMAVPAILGAGEALFAQSPAPPQNVRIGTATSTTPSPAKTLLQASDFTYLGAFTLLADVSGNDAGLGAGLAHRWVGGELRFFSTTVGGGVYEAVYPGVAKANWPQARLFRYWGDVYGGRRYAAAGSLWTWGLFWDPIDSRLYWSYGSQYNAIADEDPSIGYSILNDGTGTATGIASYRMRSGGCKRADGGMTAIPTWFSNLYCPGKRLGVGWGGYQSIVSTGPASMGPSLSAISPPSGADRSYVDNTILFGYPYGSPDRCHRDTNYTSMFGDGFNPSGGVGFWNWADWLEQAGVWVDTPTKTGLLIFPTLGTGRCYYETSTIKADGSSHWWYVFDPNDLAAVAQGKKQQWAVQPARTWSVQYQNVVYPMGPWADNPEHRITGATFDTTTNRLYVAVRTAGPGGPYGCPMVYAYQV